MDNLFKKMIYTGVGVAAHAKERLEKAIQDLVEEEKVSTKEGKKIVEEFLKSTDSKKEDVEKEVNGLVEKIVKTFSFATQSEVKELEERIAALEALVAGMDTPAIEEKTEESEEVKPAPKRKPRAKKDEKPEDTDTEEKKEE